MNGCSTLGRSGLMLPAQVKSNNCSKGIGRDRWKFSMWVLESLPILLVQLHQELGFMVIPYQGRIVCIRHIPDRIGIVSFACTWYNCVRLDEPSEIRVVESSPVIV